MYLSSSLGGNDYLHADSRLAGKQRPALVELADTRSTSKRHAVYPFFATLSMSTNFTMPTIRPPSTCNITKRSFIVRCLSNLITVEPYARLLLLRFNVDLPLTHYGQSWDKSCSPLYQNLAQTTTRPQSLWTLEHCHVSGHKGLSTFIRNSRLRCNEIFRAVGLFPRMRKNPTARIHCIVTVCTPSFRLHQPTNH